jgi:hypothetical protein
MNMTTDQWSRRTQAAVGRVNARLLGLRTVVVVDHGHLVGDLPVSLGSSARKHDASAILPNDCRQNVRVCRVRRNFQARLNTARRSPTTLAGAARTTWIGGAPRYMASCTDIKMRLCILCWIRVMSQPASCGEHRGCLRAVASGDQDAVHQLEACFALHTAQDS